MSQGIIRFIEPVSIEAWACVGGEKEKDGPLGDSFDLTDTSNRFSMPTWEQAENEAQRIALNLALSKKSLKPQDIDAVFAGDLINQCTASAYGLLSFNIPYFGIYGACSTSAEALTLGAITISGDFCKRCACVVSSHFCSAERQFRFPLEYGNQRTPTSQWTVTAASAFILSKKNKAPYITSVMPGRIFDGGITDANNMGAAMAPAVIDSLCRYFKESGKKPRDFDCIFTGDLGYEGHSIVIDVMARAGYDMSYNYRDCGLIVYDREKQDVHAGGSGCGCSASVLSGYIIPRLLSGEYKDILYIATGALMSPGSLAQGLSIPGIAHIVRISSSEVVS